MSAATTPAKDSLFIAPEGHYWDEGTVSRFLFWHESERKLAVMDGFHVGQYCEAMVVPLKSLKPAPAGTVFPPTPTEGGAPSSPPASPPAPSQGPEHHA